VQIVEWYFTNMTATEGKLPFLELYFSSKEFTVLLAEKLML